MRNRSTAFTLAVLMTLATLVTATAACATDVEEAEYKAADEVKALQTAVTESGEPIPTPVTTGGTVDTSIVSPITAAFFHERQATDYSVTLGPLDSFGVWGGFGCGSTLSSGPAAPANITWEHPHPPCDETTNHADKEITLTLSVTTYQGIKEAVCKYQGAESGVGEPCVWE
ncbi:MAG: hypothetical protein HQ477_07165 [Chloroflexi bacterium]|nr:hypothetical protein [Chloroflexota bacterium]